MKALLVLGALNGALAVMLGAFGAHGLRSRVDEALLSTWSTASEYHFFHALALLGAGILARQFGGGGIILAGWLMLGGMLVFSGSLYLLVLTGQRWLGAVTPIGGVLLIGAWLTLAWALFRNVDGAVS